jgi:phosphate/sulfate permease
MGARLSQPRGPGGTGETSAPVKEPPPPTPRRPFPRQINSRTVVAPVAAFTMACILFVYARVSIRAAKENAQRHRDVDSGGEGLSLLNEHRRRHGGQRAVEKEGGTVRQLASEVKGQVFGKKEEDAEAEELARGKGRVEEEERRRALRNARAMRGKKAG